MSAAGNGYGFIPACDRCVCTVDVWGVGHGEFSGHWKDVGG
jgi:hypothetical protein